MVTAEKIGITERYTGNNAGRQLDETFWQIDTPDGLIYGVDSNEPGRLSQRRVWLPYIPGDRRSLREKFSPYLGEKPFTPYLAGQDPDHIEVTKGLAGEDQVMLRYSFVRSVKRFVAVTQNPPEGNNNGIPSRLTPALTGVLR